MKVLDYGKHFLLEREQGRDMIGVLTKWGNFVKSIS
jgi:hypothetical protein